jgi:hypothetical protein
METQVCIFRLDSQEAAQDQTNYDMQEDKNYTLNRLGGYHVTSSTWVRVRDRDKWNMWCIKAQCPEYICFPTGDCQQVITITEKWKMCMYVYVCQLERRVLHVYNLC